MRLRRTKSTTISFGSQTRVLLLSLLYPICFQLSKNPVSTIGTLVLLNAINENEESKLTSLILEVKLESSDPFSLNRI